MPKTEEALFVELAVKVKKYFGIVPMEFDSFDEYYNAVMEAAATKNDNRKVVEA